MKANKAGKRVIVALDGLDLVPCGKFVKKLNYRPAAYKIHDLWDRTGPKTVEYLKEECPGLGAIDILVDLKLHDIPTTVGRRAKAVRDAGAAILTVHASGGVEMMRAAVENGPPIILAVTVLTSLDDATCAWIYGRGVTLKVFDLALLAREAGVHGIVCSPQEVGLLARDSELKDMEFVVPGIRPAGTEADDQKRFDTPTAAIKAGATHLVIGRPITAAPDPIAAFDAIAEEIAAAMTDRKGA